MQLDSHTDFGPDENIKIISTEEGHKSTYNIAPLWAPVSVAGTRYGFEIQLTGEEKLDAQKRYNLCVTFNCEAEGVDIDTSIQAKVHESPEFGRFTGEDMFFNVKVVDRKVVPPSPK